MKNKIVLNLSNLSGKARQWVARQIKNNLAALGFNADASKDSDNSHLGFSLSANGDKLEINFDFNNPAQAQQHIFSGATVYNEHQLTEFLAAAEQLAKNSRDTGTRGTEEAEDTDRIVDRVIDGFNVRICKHGASIGGCLQDHLKLALDSKRTQKLLDDVLSAAKEENLVPQDAQGMIPLPFLF